MKSNVETFPRSRVRTLIRAMHAEDLPQVQALDQLSFTSPWPEKAYHFELLENPNGHCWVAESVDGQISAFLVMWLVVDEIHIATLAVHPNFRRQGIGQQLVIAGLRALIPLGAVSATLEVRSGNMAAQNLYRYFGFEIVGQRKAYYQDNQEDAILMTITDLGVAYLDWLQRGALKPWGIRRNS